MACQAPYPFEPLIWLYPQVVGRYGRVRARPASEYATDMPRALRETPFRGSWGSAEKASDIRRPVRGPLIPRY